MPTLGAKDTLRIPKFSDVYLGKNLYELTPQLGYVEAKGASTTEVYFIPMPHRVTKIELKHADNVDADSTVALDWNWKREIANGLFLTIVLYAASTVTDFIEEFGETYEYPALNYKFIHNTTNTHRLYLKITIQVLPA